MPEAWRGVRDEELSQVSGIPGGVCVPAAGFNGAQVHCCLGDLGDQGYVSAQGAFSAPANAHSIAHLISFRDACKGRVNMHKCYNWTVLMQRCSVMNRDA
jgi:hypothetical protein